MSFSLITTAYSKSWPKAGRVVFLGEWCKEGNHVFKQYEKTETLKPFSVEKEKKISLINYSNNLYLELIDELTHELNRFHQLNMSKRFWTIIIGPWLMTYTRLIINRYFTIEKVFKDFDISETIVSNQESYDLSSNEFMGFLDDTSDDIWNFVLYSNIIKNLRNKKIELVQNKDNIARKRRKSPLNHRPGIRSFFKKIILFVSRYMSFFSRNSDRVIIKSYLPIIQELFLQASFFQFPRIFSTPKIKTYKLDKKARNNFFQNYGQYSDEKREIRRLVSILIPKAYLEGFKDIQRITENLNWPKNPKFIFTSNSFSVDEIFKVYTAEKTEMKVPYFVGQHGNNYGTLIGSEFWPEMLTCTALISWGWTGVYKNIAIKPAFNLKLAGKKKSNYDKNGGLLVINRGPGIRCGPHDKFFEHIMNNQYTKGFIKNLSDTIRRKLTLRLHHGSIERGQGKDILFWSKLFPVIKIDSGYSNINDLKKTSRIIVHTYDSTGVLETLQENIPTILFFQDNLELLLPEAKFFYELLVEAKILHLDNKSAANHLNEIWENIDKWWESEKTQRAKNIFCNQYSKDSLKPARDLKKVLEK